MAKAVQVIMPTKRLHFDEPINQPKKRRVAAYARVSTDSEEQLTSYEAQVAYYTRYIQSREDWEFVSVFTDDYVIIGISLKKPIKPMFFSNPNLQNFLAEWNSMYKAYIRQANQELNIQSTIAW